MQGVESTKDISYYMRSQYSIFNTYVKYRYLKNLFKDKNNAFVFHLIHLCFPSTDLDFLKSSKQILRVDGNMQRFILH